MLDFLKLRPSAPTSEALAEALDRAKAAEGEARQAERDALEKRDALLLDGDASQLSAAEKALVTARENIERTTAILRQLEVRHAAALRSEMIGRADAATQAAEAADAELRRWWEKNEASLRRILSEGHRLTVAVNSAYHDKERSRLIASQAYPDAKFQEAQQAPRDHRDWPDTIARLIGQGISKPREIPAAVIHEAVEDKPTGTTAPGSLAMGIHASQGGSTLAMTYGGQRITKTDTAA
jgi:hypothetical protein